MQNRLGRSTVQIVDGVGQLMKPVYAMTERVLQLGLVENVMQRPNVGQLQNHAVELIVLVLPLSRRDQLDYIGMRQTLELAHLLQELSVAFCVAALKNLYCHQLAIEEGFSEK